MAGLGAVSPSAEACDRVAALPVFQAARQVALYVPVDGEVESLALRAAALSRGKRVFLPRMMDDELEFVEDRDEQRRLGRWGIPEPRSGGVLGAVGSETLFVVPGIAFDLRGHRLGRGHGAYDRALVRHPAATRIGIAYEFQVVPLLPTAPWDIPMDAVVTNARIIDARRAGHDGMKETQE